MPIKDVLLPLIGDPDPATLAVIEKCVAMAGDLGAKVTALAIEIDVPVRPTVMISDDLDNAEALESVRSVSNAQGLLKAFKESAIHFDVRNAQSVRHLAITDIAEGIAEAARLKDVAVVPVKPHDGRSSRIVERLLFESGRPVLLCPQEFAGILPVALDSIVIAWDGTAPSARAVADAMPLLQAAARVRIITVTDKTTAECEDSGAALVGHLAEHGIAAVFETVKPGGSSVGKVFESYIRTHAIDLLVMGAYGHTRLNEFIWGGASNTVIAKPPCWVMMSH